MLKKFLLGTILTAAMCLTACAKDGAETDGTSAVTTAEEMPADKTNGEQDIPEITDPYAAAEKYLEELAESENVTSVELRETRINQTDAIAYKYYESPLAEKFGVTEVTKFIPVNVEYRIDCTENSGLESGDKSEVFIVKSDESGLAVVDTFAYDLKEYRGEIKEVLADEKYHGEHYLVELDGGLGTAECNNAAFFDGFEAGTRIYIEANGDIYGDTPRLDAFFMCYESEMSEAE